MFWHLYFFATLMNKKVFCNYLVLKEKFKI